MDGRIIGLVVLLGLVGAGCGSESDNNDQGIVFRAVGIFQGERQEDECEVPTTTDAISDQSAALGLFDPTLDPGYPSSTSFSTFCRGFLQLQNNLFGQELRDAEGTVVSVSGASIVVDRIDLDYEIPGSLIEVPSNSVLTGIRIEPANSPIENSFGAPNVVFTQLDGQLVPASIILYLRQNLPSLPQLPFVMIIHLTARGRMDNGDSIVSNETRYTIEWLNSQDSPFQF